MRSTDSASTRLLQWGRDIAVADRRSFNRKAPQHRRASMGPRHRCRGSRGVRRLHEARGLVASMGPRHRCRGSIVRISISYSVGLVLQWGRDIAVADRSPAAVRCTRLSSASMGPRHRCRGSLGRNAAYFATGTASMGPRHRCRGSVFLMSKEPSKKERFNGAATSLSRIGQ